MAETAILSVSLKDYKKSIDDLKGSLLGLEKTSDEYKKVAEEIRGRQQKLNEVMSVGKKEVDSTANSMNGLKAHLRELKEEVGNLDLGSEEFKKVSKEILDTTNKLKALEEAQGTFSRNVGNYKNAFLSAFSEMKEGPVGVIKGLTTLGTNMDGMIAKNGSLGGSFKALASTIKSGVISAFNVLVAHPIIATITLLGSLVAFLISKIQMSEKATKAWNRAMSVFQPVIRLVQRALGFLVEKVAEVAEWLAVRTPKAIRTVTSAFANGLRGIAKFLEGFHKMPQIIKTVMNGLVKVVGGGLSLMLKGFEKLADAVGLDGVAGALRSAQNFINNMSFDAKITSMTNALNGMADSVESFGNRAAASMENAYNMTVKQQQLEEDIRNADKAYAESQKKQLELREKIAKTSGEERKKLLKELREETEKGGKIAVDLKKRELDLAKQVAALAPNSKEDNDRLARLEAEYVQLGNTVQSTMVGIAKQEARTDKQIENAAKAAAKEREQSAKAAKKSLEQLKKEREKAAKEAYQAELHYLKNRQELLALELKSVISGSREELELRKKVIENNYKLLVLKANQEIKLEAEKIETIKKLKRQEQFEYLKLDNEFALAEYDRELNRLKLLEKVYENDPVAKTYYTRSIAQKEYEKNVRANVNKMQEFLENEGESYTKIVDKFFESLSKMGNFDIKGVKEKLKEIPNVMKETLEGGFDGNGEDLMNDILMMMFNVSPEKVEDVAKVFNELFKKVYDNIDFQDFSNILMSEDNKFSDILRKTDQDILTNEKKAWEERQKLRELEYKSGTRASLEYYQTQIQIAQRELDIINEIGKYTSETDEQYAERRLKAEQKVRDAILTLAESTLEGEKYYNALTEDEQLKHKEEMERIYSELQMSMNIATNDDEKLAAQKAFNAKVEAEEKRHAKELQKIQVQQQRKEYKTWQKSLDVAVQSTQSMASVLNDYASLKDDQLKRDVERGEKSEEEAKKEFENVKAFQIAAATMNMLASLVSINASIWEPKNPMLPWQKIALSATQSAAALMSGIMTIKQIESTRFGDSSTASSSSASGGGSPSTVDFSAVGVNPLLDSNADMSRVQNVNVVSDETSGGDRRVYLLESDIFEADDRHKGRVAQTTF